MPAIRQRSHLGWLMGERAVWHDINLADLPWKLAIGGSVTSMICKEWLWE